MAYDFLQETTTDWKGVDSRMPCHIYLMMGATCVGYIKEGTTKIQMFSSPWKLFSKRYRTFKKLTKKETVLFT